MGDDDELHPVGKLFEQLNEAFDVAAIKGGVNLVENNERRRLHLEEGEKEGSGAQRALAAGKKLKALLLLARKGDIDFDTGFEDVVGIAEADFPFATAEKFGEDFGKRDFKLVEGIDESVACEFVEFADGTTDVGDAFFDVGLLRREFGAAFGQAFVGFHRPEVDVTHGFKFATKATNQRGRVRRHIDRAGLSERLFFAEAVLFDQALNGGGTPGIGPRSGEFLLVG